MKEPASFDLPPALSTHAETVDWMYNFIWWLSAGFFILITGLVVFFCIRYHRSRGHKATPTGHNMPVEIAWTFLPIILLVFLFHEGFQGYMAGVVAPEDSVEVRVRGMQWNWEFEYPNGVVSMNELKVPVNRPVKLIMSSSDVIHSFFVPEFRIKRDVVPGMYTTQWFEATEQGEIQAFCTEYCGAPPGTEGNQGHSNMLATINVVSQAEYDKFLEEGPPMPSECEGAQNPQACWGEKLYTGNGCNACHQVGGEVQQPAPNWKGLFGREEKLMSGETVVADRNYIRESILQPQAKIVKGYSNVNMPPYRLSDKQIDALIAYMKSLDE
jgi:cytochrome c oxidase subunit 2